MDSNRAETVVSIFIQSTMHFRDQPLDCVTEAEEWFSMWNNDDTPCHRCHAWTRLRWIRLSHLRKIRDSLGARERLLIASSRPGHRGGDDRLRDLVDGHPWICRAELTAESRRRRGLPRSAE